MSMIVLASQSPRRKEILERMGLHFEIVPAKGEEVISDTDPAKVVEDLSKQKAVEVASGLMAYSLKQDHFQGLVTDTMVIGADTVVALEGSILGKPKDEEEAFAMLSALSGRTHKVYTGVTLVFMEPSGRTGSLTFHEETAVKVAELTEKEIRDYIATGEPMDKAGAYGIQGAFSCFVEKIDGDYQNVVGFPLARFYAELKKIGIDIRNW